MSAIYEHYKGDRYLLLGIATDSTNDSPTRGKEVCVYVSLRWPPSNADLEKAGSPMHVRSRREFFEPVCGKRGCPFFGQEPATPETSTISACTRLHPDRIVARFRQVAW